MIKGKKKKNREQNTPYDTKLKHTSIRKTKHITYLKSSTTK